ncbi:MAG: hypothetical protein SFY81_02195 [Verrucomicrobiota bacterium]|nr:hypothetical protein [Verrucomicrobiota bacterium]
MMKYLGLPILASEHGADVDKLILYVHYLMGALFVGWLSYFIYTLIRFRKKSNPKANYYGVSSHASTYVEGAVVVVEAILLIGFAVPLWAKVVDRFPPEAESTQVRVVAEQFAWNFRYPGKDGVFGKQDIKLVGSSNPLGYDPADEAGKDDIVPPLNEMVVPVNKPVIVYISSKDVIHSFKVAPFRITQDAIPGLSIPTWFKPTEVGRYLINCAQLCGNSHAFMKAYVEVRDQAGYDQWVTEKTASTANSAGGFE